MGTGPQNMSVDLEMPNNQIRNDVHPLLNQKRRKHDDVVPRHLLCQRQKPASVYMKAMTFTSKSADDLPAVEALDCGKIKC